MTQSSNTCDTQGPSDPRNCVGYAIKEIYLGTRQNGHFRDILHHFPGQDQTFTYSSSIDPWHQSSDLYVIPDRMESGDQVGFDLFFTSGITRGLPAMIPVALLYGTPEDAAAQIGYLEKRGYPISYIEMGEEPDGQYMAPEDYATLYLQWATALHKVDPALKLGGPVFEGVSEDIKFWPDAQGKTSWFTRFLDYLRTHGRLSDLSFMSYEHYPYYDGTCQGPWSNLFKEPDVLTHIVQVCVMTDYPQTFPCLIQRQMLRAVMPRSTYLEHCGWAKPFLPFSPRVEKPLTTIMPCRIPRLIRPVGIAGARTTCSPLTIIT